MHVITPLSRHIGGLLTIGLACLVMAGCQDSTQLPTSTPVSMTTEIAPPTEPTSTTLATASIRPANPMDAVASMDALTITAPDGMAVTSAGTESRLELDLGNQGASAGSLPLLAEANRVTSGEHALLPAGDNAFQLSPDTELDIDDLALPTARVSRQGVRISSLRVLFTVHAGRPPTWTLPSRFKLDLERRGRMHVLKGSYVTLIWGRSQCVPPLDNRARLTVDLYNGTTRVAGPLTKTVLVSEGKATFTGNSDVEFNRVALTLDLRDAK